MTVIAVQAGFGQYVFDTQPADARAALGAIQATSREALDEMRRMLGVLRQADETTRPGRRGPASRRGRRRQGRAGGAGRRGPATRRRRGAAPLLPRPAWPTWTGWSRAPRAPGSGWP